jgi:tRNA pseudouridine55 synthase
VHISRLMLIDWEYPDATLDVVCSKGTYVRALAADLGIALGSGAHLLALRRIASGGFDLDSATPLAALESCAADARDALLKPVDCLLATIPRIDVDAAAAAHLRQGRPVSAQGLSGIHFRVYAPDGCLLGIVRREADALVPERMARGMEAHDGAG